MIVSEAASLKYNFLTAIDLGATLIGRKSHLSCDEDIARFNGTLDIKTLGGAGFASQRTRSDDLELDLSDYVGIQLCIKKGDSTLPPQRCFLMA